MFSSCFTRSWIQAESFLSDGNPEIGMIRSTTARSLNFDTFKFINSLESHGLTRPQSEAIMRALSDVLEESGQKLTRQMATFSEFERARSLAEVESGQLKTEIQTLQRTDFSSLKAENDRLLAEVEKLKQKCREDINRMHAGIRLDLNLERGKLFDERSEVLAKLKEVESQMDQDMFTLKSSIQTVKFDTIRTLLTTASTVGLVILGYMRLFK